MPHTTYTHTFMPHKTYTHSCHTIYTHTYHTPHVHIYLQTQMHIHIHIHDTQRGKHSTHPLISHTYTSHMYLMYVCMYIYTQHTHIYICAYIYEIFMQIQNFILFRLNQEDIKSKATLEDLVNFCLKKSLWCWGISIDKPIQNLGYGKVHWVILPTRVFLDKASSGLDFRSSNTENSSLTFFL